MTDCSRSESSVGPSEPIRLGIVEIPTTTRREPDAVKRALSSWGDQLTVALRHDKAGAIHPKRARRRHS